MKASPENDLHARLGSRGKKLTMLITIGGRAKRTIMAVSRMFLFDSAYARRAEKAEKQVQHRSAMRGKSSSVLLNAIVPSMPATIWAHAIAWQLCAPRCKRR